MSRDARGLRIYRALLRIYPRPFRDRFEPEMTPQRLSPGSGLRLRFSWGQVCVCVPRGARSRPGTGVTANADLTPKWPQSQT